MQEEQEHVLFVNKCCSLGRLKCNQERSREESKLSRPSNRNIAHVECKNKSDTSVFGVNGTISLSFRKYLSNIWESKKSRNYRKQPYWALHTYEGWNFKIAATIYLQLIQNKYMFRSFTLLHCSHQHCVQPVASDVEVVGYL